MQRIPLLVAAVCLLAAAPVLAQPVVVSVATDGTPGNGPSLTPSMSGTGRFVAFVSFATNLVPGDTDGFQDVFLRDRDTDADGVFDEPGQASTVRVGPTGLQGNGASGSPALTPDGHYVFFTSQASNFFAVGQGRLPYFALFRWDRLTGEVVLVSRNSSGEPLDAESSAPAVTADGNTVYFLTQARNVDGAAVGSGGLVVKRDVAAGTLQRISRALGSGIGQFMRAAPPTVSDDGRVLAYGIDTFVGVGSRQTGDVTVLRDGQPMAFYSGVEPRLSRDGAFLTAVTDIDPNSLIGLASRIHLATGARRRLPAFLVSQTSFFLSSTGRYLMAGLLLDFAYETTTEAPSTSDVLAFDAADALLAYARHSSAGDYPEVVVVSMAQIVDPEGDGLDNLWGALFLNSPGHPEDVGPNADPDGDGLTNLQEFQRGSHPFGTNAAYLAEGVSSTDFFTTEYSLLNPGASPVTAAVRLERGSASDTVKQGFIVPGRGVVTLNSHELGLDTSSFSAAIESRGRLIVDRIVTWGNPGEVPYGSHGETASGGPGTQWFLAEGSTVLGFQLFYLLQNPQDVPSTATVRFLLPSGSPRVRTYDLAPHSRTTIYVNTIPGLEATDVSADISATQPIAVERAMYRNTAGQVFALGHAAAAVPAPATEWFFAEGATGDFFDTYLLFANPSAQPAHVQVQYLRDADGPVTHTYTVPPNSRFTVFVDAEAGVTTTNFGAHVTSDVGIVAERAMYWPGPFFSYYEGHVSSGATATSSLWYLAACDIGGPGTAETYVLIANTGAAAATFGVHLLSESGKATGFDRVITLPGQTRISLPMSAFPGPAGNPPPGRYGVEIFEDVTSTRALVVEGALYWSLPGQPFAAGANWPATHVP